MLIFNNTKKELGELPEIPYFGIDIARDVYGNNGFNYPIEEVEGGEYPSLYQESFEWWREFGDGYNEVLDRIDALEDRYDEDCSGAITIIDTITQDLTIEQYVFKDAVTPEDLLMCARSRLEEIEKGLNDK